MTKIQEILCNNFDIYPYPWLNIDAEIAEYFHDTFFEETKDIRDVTDPMKTYAEFYARQALELFVAQNNLNKDLLTNFSLPTHI